jgi:hypothetical protein
MRTSPTLKRKLDLYQAAAIVVALQDLTHAHVVEHERLAHGLRLMLDGKAYYSNDANSWMCESATREGKWYAVDLQHDLCTCPDQKQRGAYCKHLAACYLMWRVSDILNKAHTFRNAPENLEWLEQVPA